MKNYSYHKMRYHYCRALVLTSVFDCVVACIYHSNRSNSVFHQRSNQKKDVLPSSREVLIKLSDIVKCRSHTSIAKNS